MRYYYVKANMDGKHSFERNLFETLRSKLNLFMLIRV